MSTDFRALCAELHTAVQLYTGQNPAAAETPANELVARLMAALAATAAALAQPEPQGPDLTACDLLERFIDCFWDEQDAESYPNAAALVAQARTLLAQSEPAGVGDEELLRTYGKAKRDHCYEGPMDDWPKRAERAATVHGLRAVLAHYAHPTIEPVPVSERPWEREKGWRDLDGECWWCPPDGPPYWQMANPAMVYGGWLLPPHALPLPTPTP
jgi:hypothetical protein